MRVAIDVSPSVQTRAGTARYLKGLLRQLRERDDVEVRARSFGRNDRLSTLARDSVWYPLVLRREREADILHCPTYRGPLRATRPLVVTVHDLAVFRHPDALTAGRARTARGSCRAGSARSATPSLRGSTAARCASPIRRSTKASASPCSRRWRVACRS